MQVHNNIVEKDYPLFFSSDSKYKFIHCNYHVTTSFVFDFEHLTQTAFQV